MLLGKIVGTAISTIKTPKLAGVKLLVVQLIDKHQNPVGNLQVAADATQAGVGDTVFLMRAREAAMSLEETFVPVDLAVVGIIDTIDIDKTVDDFVLQPGYSRFS